MVKTHYKMRRKQNAGRKLLQLLHLKNTSDCRDCMVKKKELSKKKIFRNYFKKFASRAVIAKQSYSCIYPRKVSVLLVMY